MGGASVPDADADRRWELATVIAFVVINPLGFGIVASIPPRSARADARGRLDIFYRR